MSRDGESVHSVDIVRLLMEGNLLLEDALLQQKLRS